MEEYFESNQLSGFRHDKTSVVYSPKASWAGGKSMRLYPVGKTLDFLGKSQQLFKGDAERVRAQEKLQEAADCFLDLDSNPFRENYLADLEYLETLKSDLGELKSNQEKQEAVLEELVNRDKEFTDNETVYTDALKEGLFTEHELENIDDTENTVRIKFKAVNNSHDQFLQTRGRFQQMVESWAQFQREYGGVTPEALMNEKT